MTPPHATRFSGPLLLDGHVHFHTCFDLDRFLDGAAANFAGAASALGLGSRALGFLMFTESADAHCFREFRTRADRGINGACWRFERTGEEDSLLAHRDTDPEELLVLVAGRQVVAAESLEVLALGCDRDIPDGQPLLQTVEKVREAGGVAVLPWGFGKWWFGRGRTVAGLLEAFRPTDLFLGDNGGRLALGGRPRMFTAAERQGFRILPGSDPLPFPDEVDRAGSFGFRLDGALDLHRPAAAVRALLGDPAVEIRAFGSGERLLPFLRHQVAMQLRKRSEGAPS